MLTLRPPRPTRRPLLLPPGWLALGWLLLLGCLLLQAHWRQLRQVNVLQLTMPPLKQDTTGLAYYQRFSHSSDTPYSTPYESVAELNALRPWHTIDFGAQPLADFFNSQVIEDAIRRINADSSHAGGVRIRFRAGATHANLVKVLDIMNYTDQKKYWLDNRHQLATFYALTNKELPRDPNAVSLSCGCCPEYPSPPPSIWQQWLASLRQPAWQLPLLLLAALGGLNAYRLVLGARTS